LNRKILLAIFIVIFADMLGMAFMSPLLPMFSEEMGANAFWLAVISSSLGVSRFILMPVFGRLSDRTGKKKIFICSALFIYIFLGLAFTLVSHYTHIAAIRFIRGIGSAAVVPLARAYVGELSPKGQEGRYMGFFNIAFFFGMGMGPLISGVIKDLSSFDAVFYTMSGIWAFAFLVALLFIPESKTMVQVVREKSISFRKLLVIKMMMAVFMMRTVMGGLIATINLYVPLYAEKRIMSSETEIGILVASGTIVMGIMQNYAGKLADRYSKTMLVILGQISNTVFYFIIPFTSTFTELLIVRIIMSIGGALTLPAIAAITTEIGKDHGMGSAHGLFNMAMTLGYSAWPFFLAPIKESSLGIDWVFHISGIVGFVGFAAFYFIARLEKGHYGKRAVA
jgi:MFS family permease